MKTKDQLLADIRLGLEKSGLSAGLRRVDHAPVKAAQSSQAAQAVQATQAPKPPALQTADGWEVRDRSVSHTRIDPALVAEAIALVRVGSAAFLSPTVDLGRVVGDCVCVPTTAKDLPAVVFARRPGRNGLTRFVKKPAIPDSRVTLVLKRASEGPFYVLITAWIGGPAFPEPWDRRATSEARAFWKNHALAWGCEETEEGSETIIPTAYFL